jgi:hypothetical protein
MRVSETPFTLGLLSIVFLSGGFLADSCDDFFGGLDDFFAITGLISFITGLSSLAMTFLLVGLFSIGRVVAVALPRILFCRAALFRAEGALFPMGALCAGRDAAGNS